MDAINSFAEHAISTGYRNLSDDTVRAAKWFILDAIGVGIAGSSGQWTRELIESVSDWGSGSDSRVFAHGTRFPAGIAALINAYQIHNSEFDCLHEKAIVHALTAVLPASLAVAERIGGISGERLLEAVVAGVDVACGIGLGATSPMTFFRPAVAGGFGATAAVGKLMQLDHKALVSAFGVAYAQTCGSMQAHEEGTMLLAMQIGFNARNAIQACDLASRKLVAPQEVLEGRFGYYRLFEGSSDLAPVLTDLPHKQRIGELVQKPFPTGRATHGAIEAIMRLRSKHGIAPELVENVVIRITPVAFTLVGRPIKSGMLPNYARLCLTYCAAATLRSGTVGVSDFTAEALARPEILRLADKIQLVTYDTKDLGAFGPSEVEIRLIDGKSYRETVDAALGHPSNALSEDQHLAKFAANCNASFSPLPQGAVQGLTELVGKLETVPDISRLMDLATAAPA